MEVVAAHPHNKSIGRQSGITLIEVLFSVLVVSFGILAVAALQYIAAKTNHDATQRTAANLLVYDMVERMRANRNSLSAYLVPENDPLTAQSFNSEPSPDCTTANPCSPIQLARHDLWEWQQALIGASEIAIIDSETVFTGGLVTPMACITGPPSGGTGLYTLTVIWRGNADLENQDNNLCGLGTGLYGTNDEYRRMLVYRIFIS